MNRLVWLPTLLLFFSCNESPPAILYGHEACTTCKMTIMDERFGAEIISTKGKVFKFDDVICMVEFMASEKIKERDIHKKLVTDYRNKNHFLDAEKAVYLISDELHSPMNGNAGAFEDNQEALHLQHETQGVIMDWKQVYNQLK